MHITIAAAFGMLAIISAYCCVALPVLDAAADAASPSGILDNQTIEELQASVNDTPKNVYVVKAVVYEIGILTEVDDNETSFESQERVDLTFYDTHSNDSHINLGNIPLPIQTNITGQVLTGIAPVNIGAFSSPSELFQTLPLTGTIVNITHSDTAFYQLTRSNTTTTDADSDADSRPHLLQSGELAKISNVANLFSAASSSQGTSAAAQSHQSSSSSLESKEEDD